MLIDDNTKRFSFIYGEKDIFDYPLKKAVKTEKGKTVYEYETQDGLKITNICKRYEDFGAYEWVTWFENIGTTDTEIISNLNDCDIVLPIGHIEPKSVSAFLPDIEDDTVIYSPTGSVWSKNEFGSEPHKYESDVYVNHIYPNESKSFKTSGGRSSQSKAPFFNVFHKNGGYIFAVGWSGQWNATIERSCDTISFKSGIENVSFKLHPNEKIRTSSIVIMPYENCSYIESQNKWRRLVKKHFSLLGNDGRDAHGPLCAGIWGGMKSEYAIERIKLLKKNNIPVDYIWMDAGWYGDFESESPDEFEGEWGGCVGDWRVNKKWHPDGLRDVAETINECGYKYLLWFEPERVCKNTPIFNEHPDFLLKCDSIGWCDLLDLGNEDAWNYVCNMLCNYIEKLNIKFYRQDFNVDPLEFWKQNDEPDRKGITEIKHIMGLYRLWDELLKRFPSLNIDNCASGGRRIDIETLRRSVPLWRSDLQCPANYLIEATQAQNMQFSAWLPYSGTGSGRDTNDVYRIRSAYAGALTTNYMFSARTPIPTSEQFEWIRKYLNEYLRVREYFYGDFYPLTDSNESEYSWNVSQFNRPENGDGIIQAFRHGKSPFPTAQFKLNGLSAEKTYRIIDLENESCCEICGSELMENGYTVITEKERTAKLFIYKVV